MNRKLLVLIFSVAVFVVAVVVKAMPDDFSIWDSFMVTLAGFLTLCIYSFLYKDNPFYKFAEHLYVGVSAAYWMSLGFWSNIVQQAIPKLSQSLSSFFEVQFEGYNYSYYLPIALGILLLMRLAPKGQWISKWTLAYIVGTTAGLFLPVQLLSNFIRQIGNTIQVPLAIEWQGFGHALANINLAFGSDFVTVFSNWVVVSGVIGGLVYFFFSKEHTGAFGKVSRYGIWILMLTFGASFGYTVMGRVALLIGRLTFLFDDWLGLM